MFIDGQAKQTSAGFGVCRLVGILPERWERFNAMKGEVLRSGRLTYNLNIEPQWMYVLDEVHG